MFDSICVLTKEKEIGKFCSLPQKMREIKSLHKSNSRSEVLSTIKLVEMKYSGFRGEKGYFLLGHDK